MMLMLAGVWPMLTFTESREVQSPLLTVTLYKPELVTSRLVSFEAGVQLKVNPALPLMGSNSTDEPSQFERSGPSSITGD